MYLSSGLWAQISLEILITAAQITLTVYNLEICISLFVCNAVLVLLVLVQSIQLPNEPTKLPVHPFICPPINVRNKFELKQLVVLTTATRHLHITIADKFKISVSVCDENNWEKLPV